MRWSETVRSRWQLSLICLIILSSTPLVPAGSARASNCRPTPFDEIGPFYKPNAPVRSSIGKGYIVTGTVRSSADCSPIPNARIEVWQVGPQGSYDDAHRATLFSGKDGHYRLETSYPPPYARRPSHIHMLVDAAGYEGLVTQHYPKKGAVSATFDLVLAPESKDGEKNGKVHDIIRPAPGRR